MSTREKAVLLETVVSFQCPDSDGAKPVTATVDLRNDLSVEAQECDLCAMHTRVTLEVRCERCGKRHDITLRDS